jgi:hypothetical protein
MSTKVTFDKSSSSSYKDVWRYILYDPDHDHVTIKNYLNEHNDEQYNLCWIFTAALAVNCNPCRELISAYIKKILRPWEYILQHPCHDIDHDDIGEYLTIIDNTAEYLVSSMASEAINAKCFHCISLTISHVKDTQYFMNLIRYHTMNVKDPKLYHFILSHINEIHYLPLLVGLARTSDMKSQQLSSFVNHPLYTRDVLRSVLRLATFRSIQSFQSLARTHNPSYHLKK